MCDPADIADSVQRQWDIIDSGLIQGIHNGVADVGQWPVSDVKSHAQVEDWSGVILAAGKERQATWQAGDVEAFPCVNLDSVALGVVGTGTGVDRIGVVRLPGENPEHMGDDVPVDAFGKIVQALPNLIDTRRGGAIVLFQEFLVEGGHPLHSIAKSAGICHVSTTLGVGLVGCQGHFVENV